MSQETKYKCPTCGEIHDEWPALAFNAPDVYYALSEEMQKEIGELSSDFCVL